MQQQPQKEGIEVLVRYLKKNDFNVKIVVFLHHKHHVTFSINSFSKWSSCMNQALQCIGNEEEQKLYYLRKVQPEMNALKDDTYIFQFGRLNEIRLFFLQNFDALTLEAQFLNREYGRIQSLRVIDQLKLDHIEQRLYEIYVLKDEEKRKKSQ